MFGKSSVPLIIFVISCTAGNVSTKSFFRKTSRIANHTTSPFRFLPASARFLSDDRIVGGYPVNITQHPYHVAIVYDYRDFCGGSIISNRWILTGAHCIKPDYALDYKVLVGATDKFTEGVEYDVESFEVHPKFNRENYDYDFGLIRLKEEIQFNESAQPIELPKVGDGFDFVTGTWLVVTGFGHTSLSGDTTRYLQALKVPTVNQQLCKKSYYGLVTTRMFCAGFYYDGGADSEFHISFLSFIELFFEYDENESNCFYLQCAMAIQVVHW